MSKVREQLLKRSRRRMKPSETPKQKDVYISTLSEGARSEVERFDPLQWGWTPDEAKELTAIQLRDLHADTVKRRLVILGTRTKAGELIFDRLDLRGVLASDDFDSTVVDALADEVLDFNGMGEVGLEDLLGEQ